MVDHNTPTLHKNTNSSLQFINGEMSGQSVPDMQKLINENKSLSIKILQMKQQLKEERSNRREIFEGTIRQSGDYSRLSKNDMSESQIKENKKQEIGHLVRELLTLTEAL